MDAFAREFEAVLEAIRREPGLWNQMKSAAVDQKPVPKPKNPALFYEQLRLRDCIRNNGFPIGSYFPEPEWMRIEREAEEEERLRLKRESLEGNNILSPFPMVSFDTYLDLAFQPGWITNCV